VTANVVKQVAREFVDRHGPDALRVLREWAELADGLADALAARAWRDIADAAERLLRSLGLEDSPE
jgi:hypothetical protein